MIKIKTIIILFALSVIWGCSPKTDSGTETKSEGEIAFSRNCQSCHALPKPTDKTDEQWPALVEKYGQKIKLDQTQIDLINGYLIANN